MTTELRLTFRGKCVDRGGTAPVGRDSSEARHTKAPASFAFSDPAIWQGLTPQGFRVEVLDHHAFIHLGGAVAQGLDQDVSSGLQLPQPAI